MRTIFEQQEKIEAEDRLGLMTHIVLGYPDLAVSERLIDQMVAAGVDFIELQIPFSDPIADGASIMKASNVALEGRITPKDCMAFMAKMSGRVEIPLLFMSYFNIVYSYGVEAFCRDARHCGARGLIVPDMPREEEENEHFYDAAEKAELPVISVLAPRNRTERLQVLSKDRKTFLYLPSRTGVTGARSEIAVHLKEEISKIEAVTTAPVAVGFGISKPEHVLALKESGAEIAVVGSALIDTYDSGGLEATDALLNRIVEACGR